MLTPKEDFAKWQRGDSASYAGFKVVPKRDFGKYDKPQEGCSQPHGWVVTGEHGCNALPGATFAYTFDHAFALIDTYCAVGGKPGFKWALTDEAKEVAQRFWHLLRAMRYFGKV